MVENPASWGPVEKAIAKAMKDADDAHNKGVLGHSRVMRIANELREHGFINEKMVEAYESGRENSSPISTTRGGIAP